MKNGERVAADPSGVDPRGVSLARCLAVFGTGSEAGKSVLTAALCGIFRKRGVSVAPFKAQNMSNNSFVTPEGAEIGRAQAFQARCAGIEPHVDMNPLLLKPSGESRSQVVLLGKVAGEAASSEFRSGRDGFFQNTQESLARLRSRYSLIVIEGAGSCAEVNLRGQDIANFRTAIACSAPVLLVADISKGGVFAQVLGTLELLEPEERALVRGIVINRFRGDLSLFREGVELIEKKGGVPVVGVVPQFTGISVESEDSVVLEQITDPARIVADGKINIGVIRLPHISNFTDLEELSRDESVNLNYLSRPRPLAGLDLLIIPGSKNTRGDLGWLGETGWDMHIEKFAGNGGMVAGICGGYQMLGKTVNDPNGVEGVPGISFGLGLLECRTVLEKEKRLARVSARTFDGGHDISGYEIHMGKTDGAGSCFAMVKGEDGTEHPDGSVSKDGKIWGTYIHGLFDEPGFRNAFLDALSGGRVKRTPKTATSREEQCGLLAAHFEKHLDMDRIFRLAGLSFQTRS